jgi:hypothetical protein
VTSKNPYRTAGSGGVYVEREADIRLRRELSDNRRFPLIAAPQESGKTCLIRHTIDSLDPAGFCVLSVDLSRLRLGSPTQFMGELLGAIAKEGDFDQREILPDNPEDTVLAWLGTFPQRLVLFLDGCEVLERPEICEAMFGKLRLLYNIRNENEEFSRLQIFLAGAVVGRKLIPIHLQAPFGIGNEISLRPFNAEQVDALAWHLSTSGVSVSNDIGSRLTHHSGGLPFLCQQVLSSLWEDAVSRGSPIATADVDRAVEDLIERAPQIEHFANIFRIYSSDPDLLDSFHRLCRGQTLSEEMIESLTLTGLCEEDLPFRSSIYERVFAEGGPLALPPPVGQRPTRQVAIIAGPPSEPRPAREDSEAIEVNPDEDSGFMVLSEPPPPRPQPAPVQSPTELPSAAESVAAASQVAAQNAQITTEVPPVSAATPAYGAATPSSQSATPSSRTPTYAASLGVPSLPPAAPSTRTPTYLGGTPSTPAKSERTPTYAGQLAVSQSPSASTPKYPGATGSMPALPDGGAGSGMAASNKTPMYNLQMTPPIPSQRTPTYPAPGMPLGDLGAMSQPPAQAMAGDSIDDQPTRLAPAAPRSATQELREQIDKQILLSAELDLFCNTYFPHVARLFNSPLSRAEKTDLLLAHAEHTSLRERLREWSKQRREDRPEAYSNTSTESIEPLAVDAVEVKSAPSVPPASPPPVPPGPVTLKAEVPASLVAQAQPTGQLEIKQATGEGGEGFKPPATASLQVGIGLVLANRYFLTSEIGPGAVATMWNAYDRIKDEQVAIKILHGAAADNPQLVERFWRSAQQMSGLSHPTIVSVLNKPREENAIHYVVIELQSGGNLRQWVQGGKLTRMQLMRTLQRLGSALGFAHDKKVFHRDIKPTNVFVRRDLAARFSGLRRRGAGKWGLACAASQTF